MAHLPRKQKHRGYLPKIVWRPQPGQKNQVKASRIFYNRSQWVSISKRSRLNTPMCEVCEDQPSDMVDHIIQLVLDEEGRPLAKGGSAYDGRNHMCMCNRCHNIKRGKEANGFHVSSIKTPDGRIPKRRDEIKEAIRHHIVD